MKYQLELMNDKKETLFSYSGTVEKIGRWSIDIDSVSREVGQPIQHIHIEWDSTDEVQ